MLYRFGDCELDTGRFELRRARQVVDLEPQVFELLVYLIENRERVVTRRELYEHVWHGRIVTDAALNTRIKAARAAIGDDGKAQQAIRTLHRTGYRFVGQVTELLGPDAQHDASAAQAATGRSVPSQPRKSEESPPAEAASGMLATARASRRLGAVLAAAAAGSAALSFALHWMITRDADVRWLREEALPRIEALLDETDWDSAYTLAKQAEARVPGGPEIAEIWPRITWRVTIASDPEGAAVFRQAYSAAAGSDWEPLGITPLTDIRIPWGLSRLRFELPGHHSLERAIGGGHFNWQELQPDPPHRVDLNHDLLLVGPDESYLLDTEASLPRHMVRVPGWIWIDGPDAVELRDYFIGRHEVTNAQFKAFVDASGYQREEYWDPVIVNGTVLAREDAMRLFLDRTGRPGPSTWEASDYAEGEGDFPVSGVSWYEANAYARFVGQELPTALHWQHALANSMFLWLLPESNFGGRGPRAVTESRAMSHIGAYDMTGNVREWTASAIGDERVILGGSWNDPYYIAGVADASAPPLDRSATNGFRLAVTHDEPAVADRVRAPLKSRTTASPRLQQEPVSDDVYAAYSRVFHYDHKPLNAVVEATEETRVWVRERVRLDAAYGAEQMSLYLYLPVRGTPPYQTVVYWPGWDCFGLDDVDEYFAKQLDFIVKGGRAVVFPVYRGIFERRVGNVRARPAFDTAAYRDNAIDTVKDMRRAIDYLETRGEFDRNALAFFGYSWGGVNGPTALAQEPRFRVGIINIGLLPPMSSIPEVDPVNALARVRVPVLMLSGEFDPMVPVENARRYFELLGTPAADKRHVIAVGGHFIPRALVIRETIDWLEEWLGEVR